MVSKKVLEELRNLSIIVLLLGIFVMIIPYIFRVSSYNYIIFYTIIGIVLIKIAIVFREHLKIDKII